MIGLQECGPAPPRATAVISAASKAILNGHAQPPSKTQPQHCSFVKPSSYSSSGSSKTASNTTGHAANGGLVQPSLLLTNGTIKPASSSSSSHFVASAFPSSSAAVATTTSSNSPKASNSIVGSSSNGSSNSNYSTSSSSSYSAVNNHLFKHPSNSSSNHLQHHHHNHHLREQHSTTTEFVEGSVGGGGTSNGSSGTLCSNAANVLKSWSSSSFHQRDHQSSHRNHTRPQAVVVGGGRATTATTGIGNSTSASNAASTGARIANNLGAGTATHTPTGGDHLFRSNSSLELLDHHHYHHQLQQFHHKQQQYSQNSNNNNNYTHTNSLYCGGNHQSKTLDNKSPSPSSARSRHYYCHQPISSSIIGATSSLKREYGSHGSIDVISDRVGAGSNCPSHHHNHHHSYNIHQQSSSHSSTAPSYRHQSQQLASQTHSTSGESLFAMLQNYRSVTLNAIDQRSPPAPTEYLQRKLKDSAESGTVTTTTTTGHDDNNSSSVIGAALTGNARNAHTSAAKPHPSLMPQSPKLRGKFPKFWSNSSSSSSSTSNAHNNSMTSSQIADTSASSLTMGSSAANSATLALSMSLEAEEIARRRAFSHYDCQSMTTNLNYAVRLRRLLSKRRNTTTGASAASLLVRTGTPDEQLSNSLSTSPAISPDEDVGDGQTNDLVQSCPYFRNEIGGEEERIVSLTRLQGSPSAAGPWAAVASPNSASGTNFGPGCGGHQCRTTRVLHRPPLAYGVAVLELPIGETHWKHSTCPYVRLPRPIESVDQGALYYRKYFVGQEHQNWFGMDEQLGPVAISIRREKVVHPMLMTTTTTTMLLLSPTDQQHSSIVNNNHGHLNSSTTTTTTTANSLHQQQHGGGGGGGQSTASNNANVSNIMQFQYRLVIRTSELQTLRGCILEDAIPSIKSSSSHHSKTLNTKEVLEYVAPEIQLSCLRLGIQNAQTEEQLLKLDEQGLTNNYKVGVMYCKAGQSSEEEMYNNEHAGPAFTEFLETIGKRVRLNGFDKYKAGLDNKSDSTGLYSVYAQYQDCEIMFHVSTMLPFTPNNRQQLLRKRHIGNDIVTIVFQEPGAQPFTPKGIRSQFQHVFIVVQAVNPCTENTHYRVAVSRSKDVHVFGPPIKDGALFPKGKAFADFLLAKVVNAENAAHRSEKFVTMATRTRQEYLKDLVLNSSTSTPAETGQKFSIFSSGKKKEKIRPRFIADACQRGAILWQVLLDDSGQSQQVECFLGVSADTLVLIEEQSKHIVFVTPCKSILGWSTLSPTSIRIYHHQGECVTINVRENNGCMSGGGGGGSGGGNNDQTRDELSEIMERLKAVTNGQSAQELHLKRNIMGQLGFHVQPDGIVTLVESAGQAWYAGLRQNSRLVEICKVAVSTLTYDQMVDLLKTSLMVTLTVIPPMPDGSARRGCTLPNCKYNEGNYESDYDLSGTGSSNAGSIDTPSGLEDSDNGCNGPKNYSGGVGGNGTTGRKAPQIQQAGNHRRVYERSFSPPRSSNSSGYGTGSSSKSYHGPDGGTRFASVSERSGATAPANVAVPTGNMANHNEGNLTSLSNEDKWYDILQDLDPGGAGAITTDVLGARINGLGGAQRTPSATRLNNMVSSSKVANHNTFPICSSSACGKRSASNLNHLTGIAGHHNKIQISHSLPLQQQVNYSQPLSMYNGGGGGGGGSSSDYEKSGDNAASGLGGAGGSLNMTNNAAVRLKYRDDDGAAALPASTPKLSYSSSSTNLHRVCNELGGNGRDVNSSQDDHGLNAGRLVMSISRSHSEDELSNGSGGCTLSEGSSPIRYGNGKTKANNRNQSLRSGYSDPASIPVTTKLRPGVTARSSNRNSANLSTNSSHGNLNSITTSSSTGNFQEELLRLINPDNIDVVPHTTDAEQPLVPPPPQQPQHTPHNCSVGAKHLLHHFTTPTGSTSTLCKTLSRENLMNNSSSSNTANNINNGSNLSIHNSQSEPVILTMARPATVVSSSSNSISSQMDASFSSSSTVLNVKSSMHQSGSSSSNGLQPSMVDDLSSGHANSMVTSIEKENWRNLVESANRVQVLVQGSSGTDPTSLTAGCGTSSVADQVGKIWLDDEQLPMDASLTSSSSTSVPELQNHVSDLESRVNRETRMRMSLENEVKRLTEENKKLQTQAQVAVQELRKFTEWFFRNVHRQ